MQGDYICVLDGDKAIGFYDKNDLDLKNNIIAQRNESMIKIEITYIKILQIKIDIKTICIYIRFSVWWCSIF